MVKLLLFHVDIIIIMLFCRYLGHSGYTVLILNLQLETNIRKNSGKLFTTVI